MKVRKELEQQIAVFGESGSGKTVLLSSFYGAMQEPKYLRESLFNVVASDIGQGNRLYKNYLGMRNSATLPETNRFTATSYSFAIKMRKPETSKAKANPFDALRLVWHDYPGEWFEQDVSGPEEAERRVDTFRSLLGSDVALILVDAQRLIDNAGEEERYLKSLFSNFHNGILSLKDDLLVNGEKLVEFPRIWVIALSKADLLPDVDVFQFRDLIIEKACDEVDLLRELLADLVQGSDALEVGADFVLLSSAKFEPGKIELDKRIGVPLMLPLAAILPFERHVKWVRDRQLPAKVSEELLKSAGAIAATILSSKLATKIPKIGLILKFLPSDVINEAVNMAADQLRKTNADALQKHDNVRATLTQFMMDLNEGEVANVLLRSQQ
ncbi:ATP/GTP-binding protein [Populibacterium corticicola]|uniref:ATP/GTP-binding protein n=1 Tax=Populibacterium corticicola TaxID=1812826 RepID=A0ABW5XDB5_9MICO